MSKNNRAPHYVFALVLSAALAAVNPIPAFAQESHHFLVETTDAAQAIQQFGTQSGLQILASADELQGKQLHAVSGTLSTDDGLKTLLAGSGLQHRYVGERTVALVKEEASTTGAVKADKPKGFFWDRFRVAQADASSDTHQAQEPKSAQASADKLEEILVTAQKMEERLQDVPVPVTVLDTEALTTTNQVRIQDYFSTVPGFSMSPSPSSGGESMLTIRGISMGFNTNPTVGVTVDDVPYGSSANLQGNTVPDIDPSDLARVEVLRGPQGTLYGSGSMGGLLKFVTVDPSTSEMTGRLQAGLSSVRNGDSLGHNVRGSINIPVSDTFALRASAFTHDDPGYIDNPVRGVDGVNQQRVSGGRVGALWRLSDDWSVKLNALYQHTRADGASNIDVGIGLDDLEQNYGSGVGEFKRKIQSYSAVIDGALGRSSLTSVTGYNVNEFEDSIDFGFLVPSSAVFSAGTTYKFSQELRLTTPITDRIDWMLGGFYTHENSPGAQSLSIVDPATGDITGTLLALTVPGTYKEYAGFSNLTFRFTDRFDLQVGGRQSEIRQTLLETIGGALVVPQEVTKSNAFTYLVTPRLKITPNMMLYARLASGYRPGGLNANPNPLIAREFNPDRTKNYEVGFKGDLLGPALSVDASVYYIDWSNLQVNLLDLSNGQTYTVNTSNARSRGVELAVQSRPVSGLKVAAWVVWNDAELTDDFPANSAAAGDAGDRLPYSYKFSGNLAVDQEFALSGKWKGFVGATVSYVGDRKGTFVGAGTPRQEFASYTQTDLRAGVRYDLYTASLYATNVTDRRGVLGGGAGNFPPYAFTIIQPRTIGLTVARSF